MFSDVRAVNNVQYAYIAVHIYGHRMIKQMINDQLTSISHAPSYMAS